MAQISVQINNKGSGGDLLAYARSFVEERLAGFQKDITICLTGTQDKNRGLLTHAYFPALVTCCSMLELLGNLYTGETENSDLQRIFAYSEFLPQPDYSEENIRLLFVVLRHAAAHLSTLSGVRIPKSGAYKGKRITWKIYADTKFPAIKIEKESRVLQQQPPWDCPYEYRLHVRLNRLRCDIRDSVLGKSGYLAQLQSDITMLDNFERRMRQMYPQERE